MLHFAGVMLHVYLLRAVVLAAAAISCKPRSDDATVFENRNAERGAAEVIQSWIAKCARLYIYIYYTYVVARKHRTQMQSLTNKHTHTHTTAQNKPRECAT